MICFCFNRDIVYQEESGYDEVLVNKGAYLSRVEETDLWSSADVEIGRDERSEIKVGMGRLWSLRDILVVMGLVGLG